MTTSFRARRETTALQTRRVSGTPWTKTAGILDGILGTPTRGVKRGGYVLSESSGSSRSTESRGAGIEKSSGAGASSHAATS